MWPGSSRARSPTPKWRNRQTRRTQNPFPLNGVWVRLPPSALLSRTRLRPRASHDDRSSRERKSSAHRARRRARWHAPNDVAARSSRSRSRYLAARCWAKDRGANRRRSAEAGRAHRVRRFGRLGSGAQLANARNPGAARRARRESRKTALPSEASVAAERRGAGGKAQSRTREAAACGVSGAARPSGRRRATRRDRRRRRARVVSPCPRERPYFKAASRSNPSRRCNTKRSAGAKFGDRVRSSAT